jgi:hypothetical protein
MTPPAVRGNVEGGCTLNNGFFAKVAKVAKVLKGREGVPGTPHPLINYIDGRKGQRLALPTFAPFKDLRDLRVMKKTLLAALFLWPSAAAAQSAAYDSITVAWDRGQYVAALDGMLRLLRSPQAAQFLEPIALLTGELYTTTTVAADGRNPRWTPDGSFFVYETGTAAARQVHRVSAQRDSVPGYGAVTGRDGMIVFRATESTEILNARSELASLTGAAAAQKRAQIAELESRGLVLNVITRGGGAPRVVTMPGYMKHAAVMQGDVLFVIATAPGETTSQVFRISANGQPEALTSTNERKTDIFAAGDHIVFTQMPRGFGLISNGGQVRTFDGVNPSASADGRRLVYVGRQGTDNTIELLDLASGNSTVLARKGAMQLANPAISPDGRAIVYQMMPREDWELFLVDADGKNERRLTREIQHDLLPRFVDNNTVLAVMGEARHRRSYLYDVASGRRTRLFHNNTVRTVAPEYQWSVSPDGNSVIIVADRDGNTISPERGVYRVDLTRKVTREELISRLQAMRAGEVALQRHAQQIFAALRTRVAAATSDVSTDRIYGYGRDMFEFDSKYITQPGNALAIAYLERKLRQFGYEPELQWFEPRPGVRTANVIATLRGTTNPEMIYVISSHFDSVERGPGADDNTSGTSALLEAARVLARRPQAGTIKFAFFTGEEAGLLGSREFVRRAVADKIKLVGALNNDMVGWRNDQRLDNTIRYSNDGVRDLQHAAAMLFSNLITYDSRYYQNTDAHAYYEAYGDIVGGIGSYPILGNPHYHQPHDVLETIDQQLVAEVSKTTVATIMWMANSPTLPRPASK